MPSKITRMPRHPVNQMLWCSSHCVVLLFDTEVMLVGPNNMTQKKSLGCSSCWAYPELDGIRIVTNKTTRALRLCPQSYTKCLDTLSLEPSAMLYEAYTSFEEQKPLPYEDPRNNKVTLVQAVQDCLAAASFEVDGQTQYKLLKAALYGKIYLSPQ